MAVTPGQTICDLRTEQGLSPEELGKLIDIPGATIRSIENGRTASPRPSTQKKLADHFELKVRDIWPVEEAITNG